MKHLWVEQGTQEYKMAGGEGRRMLGPVQTSMGGASDGVVTLSNFDGFVLTATGQNNVFEGVSGLRFNADNTALSASTDLYIAGAGKNLYIQGTNESGDTTFYKFVIQDGGFYVIPSGSSL